MANWKAKRNNNFEQKKKEFVPNRNSKDNNTRNFPNNNFQGNKVIHRPIRIIKGIKNLLTTTVTIQRTLTKGTHKVLGMQWSALCISLPQSEEDC